MGFFRAVNIHLMSLLFHRDQLPNDWTQSVVAGFTDVDKVKHVSEKYRKFLSMKSNLVQNMINENAKLNAMFAPNGAPKQYSKPSPVTLMKSPHVHSTTSPDRYGNSLMSKGMPFLTTFSPDSAYSSASSAAAYSPPDTAVNGLGSANNAFWNYPPPPPNQMVVI